MLRNMADRLGWQGRACMQIMQLCALTCRGAWDSASRCHAQLMHVHVVLAAAAEVADLAARLQRRRELWLPGQVNQAVTINTALCNE